MSGQVYLFIMITAMLVTAVASYVVNMRRFRKEFEERKLNGGNDVGNDGAGNRD